MIQKKFVFLITALIFLASLSYAAQTVTVVQPNDSNRMNGTVGGAFSYVDGNFVAANHDVNVDIYYSLTAGAFTNALVVDANADAYCTGDGDYAVQKTCTYPFDTSTIPDGNYFIDINVTTFTTADASDQNSVTDSSDANFQIDNSVSALTISSPADRTTFGFLNNDLGMAYSSSESDIAKYWLQLDFGGEIDNGTNTTYTFNDLAVGSHILTVKATDTLDNNSAQASVTITIAAQANGGIICGDNTCNGTETAISCARDCPAVCGDESCTHTESPETCPADCGITVVCGNGVCDEGETSANCPADCEAEDTTVEDDEDTDNGQSGGEQPDDDPVVDAPTCSEINCDDNNPCTNDSCENATCFNIPKQNGVSCGTIMECKQGICIETPIIEITPPTTDNSVGLIAASVAIIGILAYVFYFRK